MTACSRHRGYALLAALLALISLSALMLAPGLLRSLERQQQRELRHTLRELRDAELALIMHGLIEDSTPGALPSPSAEDVLNGRSSTTSFLGTPTTPPRRLPWHFLGLPAPHSGHCLWYVVSAGHRNNIFTQSRQGNSAIHPGNSGLLQIQNADDATLSPAVAVLFAPGAALPHQTGRLPASFPDCSGGPADSHLDQTDGINNASGDGLYIQAARSESFNDLLRPINSERLLRPALKRVLQAFAGDATRAWLLSRSSAQNLAELRTAPEDALLMDELVSGLSRATDETLDGLDYKNNATCPSVRLGGITSYKHPVSWLCFNDWYPHLVLLPSGGETYLRLRLRPGDDDHYHCDLVLGSGQISCRSPT